MSGHLISVNVFQKEFSSNKLAVAMENVEIERIQIKTITMEDIPHEWRDPQACVKALKPKAINPRRPKRNPRAKFDSNEHN